MLDRLHQKGIEAETQETTLKGKKLYRLRVAGFTDRTAAEKQARELKKMPDFADAWVAHESPKRNP